MHCSKYGAVLLFLGVLSFAIAIHDIHVFRSLLSASDVCATAYSAYIKNCTLNFQNDIKKCEENEQRAKLRIQLASALNRKRFVVKADVSCKAISECDYHDKSAHDILLCLSEESAKTAASMNNMYYEVSAMESEYNKQLNNVEHIKNTCTNATTWVLSERSKAASDEVNKCYRTGEWDLAQAAPLIAIVDTPKSN